MKPTLILLALLLSTLCRAAVIYVPDNYATIQDAIDGASKNDTIIVRPGIYVENIDFRGKAVTVRSERGPAVTTIDGGSPTNPDMGSVVVFQNGEGADSVLRGFTLVKGTGIRVPVVPPVIYMYKGGGIFCEDSSPTIAGNIITANFAIDEGGGIWCSHSDSVISNNTISANGSNSGGGIHCYLGSPTITGNRISTNRADFSGGGIQIRLSGSLIAGNCISENSAACNGGGICCSGPLPAGTKTAAFPTIVNNIIVKNSAARGGGIECGGASARIICCTLFANSAGSEGGGIHATFSRPIVADSILWNDTAPAGKELFVGNQFYSAFFTISYSDVDGGLASVNVSSGSTLTWGPGMIDALPLFAEEAAGDFHLTFDSPCRNAGDNTALPALLDRDFEGDPRIVTGKTDMGADEFYRHLYCVGALTPGGSVSVRVAGKPGEPVALAIGSGICIPPCNTAYGPLYLRLPLAARCSAGLIPANGILLFSAAVPTSWAAGEQHVIQALEGLPGSPGSRLTNPLLLTVD